MATMLNPASAGPPQGDLRPDPGADVWRAPPGERLTIGWRHLVIVAVIITLGAVISSLSTVSFGAGAIGSGPGPAMTIQAIAGLWFGGWGMAAGILFPYLAQFIGGPPHPLGLLPADVVQSCLVGLWFRAWRLDPRLPRLRDTLAFVLVGGVLSNVLGAALGIGALYLATAPGDRGAVSGIWWRQGCIWAAANIIPCLLLGLPLLQTLSPVVVRSSVFCRTLWRSSPIPAGWHARFKDQPIILKMLAGLVVAGLLPLLIVAVTLIQANYGEAEQRAKDRQRELANSTGRDLTQFMQDRSWIVNELVEEADAPDMNRCRLQRLLAKRRKQWGGHLTVVPLQMAIEIGQTWHMDQPQVEALRGYQIASFVGPGLPPQRAPSINILHRLHSQQPGLSDLVVWVSAPLDDLRNAVFSQARVEHTEYALSNSGGDFLRSPNYQAVPAAPSSAWDRSRAGTMIHTQSFLAPYKWRLDLETPTTYGVIQALQEQQISTAAVVTLALFATLLVGGYMARSIERPIRELTATVQKAAEVGPEVEATVDGDDEIGHLARAFNTMSARLRVSMDRLRVETAERERLARELEIAAQLQRQILPAEPPEVPGFEIAGLCVPAREIGGDFFDFIPVSAGRIALVVGDACGKGLAAGFLMNESRTLVRAYLAEDPRPRAALARTNQVLLSENSLGDLFVTMIYALLDPATRRLEFANAAQPPALWWQARTGQTVTLDTPGRALGFDPGNPIGEATVQLDVGDVVVLYTDGVIDPFGPDGQSFGIERFQELLGTLHHLPAAAIAAAVHRAVQDYAGHHEAHDDLTLLVLRGVARENA